ncbi:hypothetical protein BJ170DRAFT_599014 [Xylariales sp. AK1849]|nr:hypothetical protein BJ170DRAFT_599014 [Xylariales sp. AK1849]
MEEQKPPSGAQLRAYAYLAKYWSKTQTGMVRKFGHLAALNILYLQADLCHLEYELNLHREADVATGEEWRVDCDWDWLLLSRPELNKGSKQWATVLAMRQKLDEYLAKLSKPTEQQRKTMCRIIGSSSLNDRLGRFQSLDLAGIDGPMLYGSTSAADLILLDTLEEEGDAITRWIVHPLLDLFHCVWRFKKARTSHYLESGSDGENIVGMYEYSRDQVQALSLVVGALASAVMPLVSMVILYRVNNMDIKVALVCVFTILFCLAMSVLSKARRIEIFAATAAFGSVQVVWISQAMPDGLDKQVGQ